MAPDSAVSGKCGLPQEEEKADMKGAEKKAADESLKKTEK